MRSSRTVAWASFVVLGSCLVSGTLIACTADDDDSTYLPEPDAGFVALDATVTLDSAPPASDSGVMMGDDDAGNGDDASTAPVPHADGGSFGIWAFNGYCGDTGSANVACPAAATVCPASEAGVGAELCLEPGTECVSSANASARDSGILVRVFHCLPEGHAVWALNALCTAPFGDCTTDAATAVAACSPDDAGIEGQGCTPSTSVAVERCMTATGRYVCQPGNDSTWLLDGYCDAGPTGACGTSTAACGADAGDAGFAAGEVCPTPFARCLSGDRIFLCAAH